MNYISLKKRSGILKVSLLILFMFPMPVDAAVVYKSYVVQKDKSIDILCDPYIVQKDDYLWKLFREKGEISEKDFPEFEKIFGRLNPHIKNMDRIVPGQQILIPLKKLNPDAYPNQESGLVTIPFMTLVDTTELLKTNANVYKVKRGDSVSVLIAKRFGNYNSRSYNAGVKLFQFLNPDVKDLDLIYTGQELLLPDASIQDESWYASLMEHGSGIVREDELNDMLFSDEDKKEIAEEAATGEDSTATGLAKVANLLEAKLINRGRFFFPKEGEDDVELDLNRFPMMELKNGSRIIFPDTSVVKNEELDTIISNLPDTTIVPVSHDDSHEHILDMAFQHGEITGLKNNLSFTDHGLEVEIHSRWIFDEPETDFYPLRYTCITPIENPEEHTPNALIEYLRKKNIFIKETLANTKEGPVEKTEESDFPLDIFDQTHLSDPQKFVVKCLELLGYPYVQRSTITFPYAGIQIKAISNIILRSNNVPLLVDFGDFHGDAVMALEKTGFDIVQIFPADDIQSVLLKIIGALQVSFSENPKFYGAKRSGDYNISFTIPGLFLPEVNASKVLFAYITLPEEVQKFLTSQRIRVVQVMQNSGQDQSSL